ncbi:hypothetical protein [Pseudodesulfovibrio indicus]|uniref:ABC-type transport auxiliary lipoprotein component domain-containing protein n=1 Tax=Pseudodesulfovibrio indicus TaxID=1716143 RepID=A0A126QK97_9BACT|nr:hypothetical protein [Pseudodesulfovibrio indicus]AMK10404.1 hypothetical protein AWY79_04375 [Pseudodesulfovibrio indicus]TDT89205.1 hypothetical protein EDC59_104198 [Pseudodesulfovibrio indicus]
MKAYMKWVPCLALLLAVLAGCASGNGIKLKYALISTDSPCAGEVVVFKFEDKRAKTVLGKTRDNQQITTLSDVADWVGWALFDELENAGCKPKYRATAIMPGDDPVVTGEILALELNQTGVTTYKGRIELRLKVTRGGEIVHLEKYSSEVEDVVVPGYSTESDILAEALRGVMFEAIPAIAAVTSGS